MLVGVLCLPATMAINLGMKLTPGRISIILLFVPALITLKRKISTRQTVVTACDFFAFALAAWMIVATILAGGSEEGFSSAVAEALEFFGSFLIGRAYFSETAQLRHLVRVLKITFVIIAVPALIEFFSGRYVINDLIADLFNVPVDTRWWVGRYDTLLRNGFARAASTFEHPIIYGSYCATIAAISLYSDFSLPRRLFYFGVCLAAGFLALSSGPLLCFIIVAAVATYDYFLKDYSWRWKLLTVSILGMIGLTFLVSNDPLAFFINHLVLDPASSYYRLLTWIAAIEQIKLAPLVGIGFGSVGNVNELNHTIDCVYLVLAIRFGLPAVAFLLLAVVTAYWHPVARIKRRPDENYRRQMRTAFTLVIVLFALVGLETHYWNNIWQFFAFCIGIRAALGADGRFEHPSSMPSKRFESSLEYQSGFRPSLRLK